MKLAIIIGTRPEIIRLSIIIKKCKELYDLVLIHTGQNWDKELNDIFFDELEIPKPNYFLDCNSGSLGENMGNIISRTYNVLSLEQPDAMLVLGDTNSGLSVISAKRLKIPIFHMEAGNRCFDDRVPEEINRRIIDHTSDINICYTENSRRYLINEGIKKDSVFVVGSPIREVINYYKYKDKSENFSRYIEDKFSAKMRLITRKKYILASIHREDNLDINDNFDLIMQSLIKIKDMYTMPIVFSTHPRATNKIKDKSFDDIDNIYFCKPFGFKDYVELIENSYCYISDSGTACEEAAILNVPTITLRNSIERPEAIENGNIIMSTPKNIIDSIKCVLSLKQNSICNDYLVDDTSNRVIKIIQSYYESVNKKTWFK